MQDRVHAALEQELIEKEDVIADLTEQNQRLEYALKVNVSDRSLGVVQSAVSFPTPIRAGS